MIKKLFLLFLLILLLAFPAYADDTQVARLMMLGSTPVSACAGGSEMIEPNDDSTPLTWTALGTGATHAARVRTCSNYVATGDCTGISTTTGISSAYASAATDVFTLTDHTNQCSDASEIKFCAWTCDDGSDVTETVELKLVIDSETVLSAEGAITITRNNCPTERGPDCWTFSGAAKTWSAADVDAATLQVIYSDVGDSAKVLIYEIVGQVTWP